MTIYVVMERGMGNLLWLHDVALTRAKGEELLRQRSGQTGNSERFWLDRRVVENAEVGCTVYVVLTYSEPDDLFEFANITSNEDHAKRQRFGKGQVERRTVQ